MKKSFLTLENGMVFEGAAPDWQSGECFGEVVFTTGMTGYCESLTDPSFMGQILTFTYPLIGNYGIADSETWESKKIHAKALVINENSFHWSHHSGKTSLLEWLKVQKIPLIVQVDTRALAKTLRASGTMRGIISDVSKNSFDMPASFSEQETARVSVSEVSISGKGKRVIAVDCGMKESIFRILSKFPIEIVRVPYDYDYSHESFDGVFLSNGPGDPSQCIKSIDVLKKAMKKKKPIFGVCLGNQMLALAAGAKTYKLKFGHRGQNQPCIDVESHKCYVTSQNHGYAVDEKTLPSEWKVTFRNLNDNSIEGICHKTEPFSAVQFHPEGCPGPTDTRWFFERFYACL